MTSTSGSLRRISASSARESEDDRARGLAAGADAYLAKSAFDQRNLLATITQLLGE